MVQQTMQYTESMQLWTLWHWQEQVSWLAAACLLQHSSLIDTLNNVFAIVTPTCFMVLNFNLCSDNCHCLGCQIAAQQHRSQQEQSQWQQQQQPPAAMSTLAEMAT